MHKNFNSVLEEMLSLACGNFWQSPGHRSRKNITVASEDVEKKEPLNIVGGNVRYHSHDRIDGLESP